MRLLNSRLPLGFFQVDKKNTYMKSSGKLFLLLGITIYFFSASIIEQNRIFTLLLPIKDLKQVESQDLQKILALPILVGVHSREDLEVALNWGLRDRQIVIHLDTEVPDWYQSQYSLIFSNRENKVLRLPDGLLPMSMGFNLATELVPSRGLSPVDIFGSKTIWMHRIFEEEIPLLSVEDRWNRFRRALRERSVFVLEFSFSGSNSYYQEINSFLDFLGHRWRLGLSIQPSQIPTGLDSKLFKVLTLLVLAIGYGPFFLIFLPLLMLPGTLGIQVCGFLFTIIAPLVIYFQLQKWNSPGGILLIPLGAFFHSLVMGSFYSLLMLDSELQMRAEMPIAITLSLLIPILTIVLYELIGFLSGTILRPFSESRRFFILASLIGIAYLVLIIMMYRSNNYSGFPIWDWEIQMRLWFEEHLYARPRTREILGYLGLVFILIDSRYPKTLIRFLGRFSLIILLVSSMNTYCHLHTEFWFRVLRQFHGFWIGLTLFIIFAFLVCRLSKKSGVLRLGYFGFGNLGDDLLAYASIQNKDPESNYFMVAKHTGLNLPGEIQRRELQRILDRLVTARKFVLGPGGILQDKTSLKSILYYLSFSLMSKFFGAQVEWSGHGVSPFKYGFSRKMVGFCGRFTDRISVRDDESRQVLMNCSISPVKISVSRDMVFNLVFRIPPIEKKSLGIVLRSWKGFPLKRVLKFLGTLDWEKTYYLFQEDEQLAHEISKFDPNSRVLTYRSRISDFMKSLMGSERVIAMRYHGLVLAVQSSRPVFSICYDEKCMNLARESNIEGFIQESEWHQADLLENRLSSFLD